MARRSNFLVVTLLVMVGVLISAILLGLFEDVTGAPKRANAPIAVDHDDIRRGPGAPLRAGELKHCPRTRKPASVSPAAQHDR